MGEKNLDSRVGMITVSVDSIEQRVAGEILDIIDEVCFSEEYREYRINYGSKGERDLVISKIKERYGV